MMDYNFCPKCGSKLERKLADHKQRLVCSGCNFIFYQNSKPTASALIIKGDKILLGKRAREPFKGDWDIPGGFLEESESLEDGLAREIMEELGVRVINAKLLGVLVGRYYYTKFDQYCLNLYFLTKIDGEIKPGDDINGAKWFSKEKMPKNIAFDSNVEALKRWFK